MMIDALKKHYDNLCLYHLAIQTNQLVDKLHSLQFAPLLCLQ